MSSIAYGAPVVLAVAALLAVAYARHWAWTGFTTKTLWDWLQLLVIPVALAVGAFALNQLQSSREHRRTIASSREAVLRTYLQQISNLMLDRNLLRSQQRSEVRIVGRTLTLTALRQLDGERKGLIVRFLAEARLVTGTDPKISLRGADLHNVVLENAVLPRIRLDFSKLSHANFRRAHLAKASFAAADLRHADFIEADGTSAYFILDPSPPHVIFHGANLTDARFHRASFLSADFRFARMIGAKLGGANLSQADFRAACLTRADFRGTVLEGANLDAVGHKVNFAGALLGPLGAFSRGISGLKPRKPLRSPEGWDRTGSTFASDSTRAPVAVPRTLEAVDNGSCNQ